jgi:hypothetical protein
MVGTERPIWPTEPGYSDWLGSVPKKLPSPLAAHPDQSVESLTTG